MGYQRHFFRYNSSTIPLLPKFKILSPLSSVVVQPSLCLTWSLQMCIFIATLRQQESLKECYHCQIHLHLIRNRSNFLKLINVWIYCEVNNIWKKCHVSFVSDKFIHTSTFVKFTISWEFNLHLKQCYVFACLC